jgi:peptidoglycan hydrolase-like protein with peptidoglycan-binding domain
MGISIPAGATGYFGVQTQAAVSQWQSSKGVSPAAGYFGPISRAAWASVVVTPPPGGGEKKSYDETTSWEFKHPCGAKLTIAND